MNIVKFQTKYDEEKFLVCWRCLWMIPQLVQFRFKLDHIWSAIEQRSKEWVPSSSNTATVDISNDVL